MERALYRLLCREERRGIALRGHKVEMKLLTAQELLEIRGEETGEDDLARALHTGAALAARSLHDGEERVFRDAGEVLGCLSGEEINYIMDAYRNWSEEVDPGFESGEERVEQLKKA